MKIIKSAERTLRALFFVTIALFCAAVPAFAASEGSISGRDALTVGVPADRCPVFYIDADTGELTEIGVDLMRFAADKAGYDVTFRVIGEGTLKEALDSEEYDLLMPFGSSVESASGRPTVVSDNLMKTPFTLVTESGSNMPHLNELRVGMLKSLEAGAETVRGLFPGIVIIMYDNMPESVEALREGKVDALMHNSYVWSYVLQKPAYSDLSVLPSAVFSMDFRAGAPDTPSGREIIRRLNGGIAELTDTFRQAVVLDYTALSLIHI